MTERGPTPSWGTGALMVAIRVVYASNWFLLGPVLPQVAASFHVGGAEATLAFWSFLVGVGAFQIPAGLAASRWGARPLVVAGLLLLGLAEVGSGFSPTFPIFLALRFAMGVGAALFFSTGVALVSQYFPGERQGLFVGAYYGAFNVGGALGVFLPALLASRVPWPTVTIAFGLVTALSALVALGGLPAGSDEGEDRSPPSERSRDSLFHSRPLLFMGLSLVGLWAASYALVEYLVPYAVSFRGFSPAGAGTIDGLGFGASLAGSSLGGVLADRSPRLLATFVALCVAAAISVLFIPFTPGAAISVWVLAFGAFQGMGFSLLYLLPLKFHWVSPRTYSLGLGLFETLQVLLGSLLVLAGGVFFFGPGHPDAGWVYLALVTVLSLGTLLGLRQSRGDPRDPAPQGGAGTGSGGTGSSVR